MGAVKGTVSYTRFYVWGELEGSFQDRFMRSIRNRTFEPLVAQEPDDEHIGWCSIEDPFDLELTRDKVFNNNFLNLALRIDRWRIPQPVFKAHFAEAERQHLERKGREKLNKREKDDLKVFINKRLRKQVIPAMKITDLSWDMDGQVVRFWNNSAKMHERLLEIFEKTFKLKLVPESPYSNAVRRGITEKQALSLVNLELSTFHKRGED